MDGGGDEECDWGGGGEVGGCGEGVGGVQDVKVSIWWMGREREVAMGLMGTEEVLVCVAE